jgi:hypothetical protein
MILILKTRAAYTIQTKYLTRTMKNKKINLFVKKLHIAPSTTRSMGVITAAIINLKSSKKYSGFINMTISLNQIKIPNRHAYLKVSIWVTQQRWQL